MRRWRARVALVALTAALACVTGCGGHDAAPSPQVVTRPIGVGPAFQLPALGEAATGRRPIGALECRPGSLRGSIVAHLEIFARRSTLVIPAGIGVLRGRCRYPLRTLAPTGLIVAGRAGLTLGDLFAVWGQPLGRRRLAGFSGPVAAFVGGKRVAGDVRRIPIRHHSQIVVEVSGYVPPHAHYVFPRAS